jgi:hypothetical protein
MEEHGGKWWKKTLNWRNKSKASLEKPLGETKEIEETVGKKRKLQKGNPGKTVEHRGKHITKASR